MIPSHFTFSNPKLFTPIFCSLGRSKILASLSSKSWLKLTKIGWDLVKIDQSFRNNEGKIDWKWLKLTEKCFNGPEDFARKVGGKTTPHEAWWKSDMLFKFSALTYKREVSSADGSVSLPTGKALGGGPFGSLGKLWGTSCGKVPEGGLDFLEVALVWNFHAESFRSKLLRSKNLKRGRQTGVRQSPPYRR